MLGLKGLAWRSVEIPVVMPKPGLTALTGGYRKTPVLQIGADIYCDTRLMGRRERPASRRCKNTTNDVTPCAGGIFRSEGRSGDLYVAVGAVLFLA